MGSGRTVLSGVRHEVREHLQQPIGIPAALDIASDFEPDVPVGICDLELPIACSHRSPRWVRRRWSWMLPRARA